MPARGSGCGRWRRLLPGTPHRVGYRHRRSRTSSRTVDTAGSSPCPAPPPCRILVPRPSNIPRDWHTRHRPGDSIRAGRRARRRCGRCRTGSPHAAGARCPGTRDSGCNPSPDRTPRRRSYTSVSATPATPCTRDTVSGSCGSTRRSRRNACTDGSWVGPGGGTRGKFSCASPPG